MSFEKKPESGRRPRTRLFWTILLTMLGLVLLLGAVLTAGEEAGEGRWLLSHENPKKGQIFNARLFLPECKTTADCAVEVTLVTSSAVWTWFAGDEGTCRQPTASEENVWAGCTPPTGVLRVCGMSHHRQGFDLAAVVVQLGPESWRRSLVTRTVTLDPGWQPGALTIALITATAGFLTGLAGYLGQRWVDRSLKTRDTRETIILTITRSLLGEFGENVEKLKQSIQEQHPTKLSEGGYHALSRDCGAIGFLKSDERAPYLRSLEALYQRIDTYNTLVEEIPIKDNSRLPVEQRPLTLKALELARSLLQELEAMCREAREKSPCHATTASEET